MKILTASETKQVDAYTIEHTPIASIDLMERAANACFEWIKNHYNNSRSFKIICGTGNNGGDGLAIARMLDQANYNVSVYIVRYSENSSDDFQLNEKRLLEINSGAIVEVHTQTDVPPLGENDVVIDAIFGTGLTKPAEGLVASFIRHINNSKAKIIAIDIPSGLFADVVSDHNSAIIKATHTLSFQSPKLAFMFQENDQYVGNWQLLDIGLDIDFINHLPSEVFLIEEQLIKSILKPRPTFSHKGFYGHGLLIAGSYGKIGAAVLAAKACMRSGIGLLTVHVPKCGYEIIQISVPEAMVQVDTDETIFTDQVTTDKFTAIGIGCGIGTDAKTKDAFIRLLTSSKIPLVIDADAINLLGLEKKMIALLPENSVLTPHSKEFERISEKPENDFHRHELQVEFAGKNKVFVVLKGAHSCIACPDGKVFFNNTGNPGMAKGGSGDALTGIILSFLAQGYSSEQACILGIYFHGSAGDIAAQKIGMQAMTATDLIENLSHAFNRFT